MSTSNRLVEMILRGKPDQFNTVIKEYLNDRASVMMEQVYLEESKNILKLIEPIQSELNEAREPNVQCMRCDTKKHVNTGGYQWKSGKSKCSCGGSWDEIAAGENEKKKPKTNYPSPGEQRDFTAESSYQLRDGAVGILTESQQDSVGKLYKSLNTDNRQRLVKLLSESQESFNRILNLAKIESTKNGNK